MKLLNNYKNGNYQVYLFDDGTKIRQNNEDKFLPDFPESIDMKITDKCKNECRYCYQNSSRNGSHANLNNPILYTMKPGTEIAVGGGDIFTHPDLNYFLERMKSKGVICNITVHQDSFCNNLRNIEKLIKDKLIHGVGVSVDNPSPDLISLLKTYDNLVVHVINGITPIFTVEKLYNQDLKLLILGKKPVGYTKDTGCKEYYDIIEEIQNNFKIVSYDNLALEQLKPERFLSEDEFNILYQGNEGKFSMYIDAVENKFAKNSITQIKNISNEKSIGELFKNL